MTKYEYQEQCIRRVSIWACLVILIISNINGVAEGAHKAAVGGFDSIHALAPVSKLLRPAFHFQPPKHWINGPMYYKGVYHLFYQYNPKGSVWGNIVWAHSVSTDMINWQSVDPALYPSKPFDIEGCWSGSATILPKTGPAILYTGLDPQMNQVQNIALPANLSDPYLRVWVKPDYNPLVVPGPEMNATCFRDPTTAWYNNGHWKMVVGGMKHRGGVVYLYRSKDFKRWVKAKHPLHFVPNMGMWECPDFFPVSMMGQNGVDTSSVKAAGVAGKHVLKVSLDRTRYEYYTLGRYEKNVDRYFPDDPSIDGWNGMRYDYGNFYASKTFFDPKKNRRILWGWANESDAQTMDVQKGWAGIQTIPRKVWLDPTGKQLVQWPIEEVETLRQRQAAQIKNHTLHRSQFLEIKGVTAAQVDVEVVFGLPSSLETAEELDLDPRWVNPQDICGQKGSTVEGGVGPFGLLTLASSGLEEYTPVFFRVFKAPNNTHTVLFCSDASRSSLMSAPNMYKPSFAGFVHVDLTDRKLSLRSLIDHSVVESFGAKGKTCITSRVYPTKAVFGGAHLYVFNNGTSPVTVETLDAWSMASPVKMNQPLA
ncbi:hypothetical protein V2J09_004246 [Rumex salicifolius]